MHIVCILMALTLAVCLAGFAADVPSSAAASPEASGDLNLEAMVQPVPPQAIFREAGSHIWCCTMTKGDDGKYHIFYSRWPNERGHRAWVTHCEVAHGVGDSPLGPFKFSDVALAARGTEYWDGSCTHNPTVFRGKDGKYYLYHMGNRGDGKDVIPLNMVHRNNQRVGVAIADSPYGPWKRFDKPALDVSEDPNAPDALMTSNPAVCERPEGGYLMIYKGVSKPNAEHPRGVVRFFVATSDKPEGPFKKQLKEVMSEAQVGLVTEDPCLWRGTDRYWAIMRLNGTAVRQEDGTYRFGKAGKSLALFESFNGLDWKPAKHTHIVDLNLKWEGEPLKPICIERPQIYLENGRPKVLIFASTEKEKNVDGSFDVFIPLEKGAAVMTDPDFSAMIQPIPESAKFTDPDFYIWCGTMVRGDDGKYHLYYSRWPRKLGHYAWVTHSEIAHAVADSPLGTFVHHDVALPARGKELWDGLCTHNPNVHKFGNKYYLYYMGNTGDGVASKNLNFVHRNNQRVGVAVADSPDGPWQRFDKPVIEPTPGFIDALCATNPTVTERPGGGYLMIYKAVDNKGKPPFGGPVLHAVATSDSPTGPFKKHPTPVFVKEGVAFAAEDPFIWSSGNRYWAIVKDNAGHFTGKGKSTALFQSDDGLDWKLAKHPLVATTEVKWSDGRTQKLHSLERPQLFFENGQPTVLMFAVDEDNKREHSLNIRIPLRPAP